MYNEIDILENDIITKYPNILEILLRDHTTNENIFWATDNYKHIDKSYSWSKPILPELISGVNGSIIVPRVFKDKVLQQARSKEMAEVFTPSWVCNAQNNLIDNAWFGREGVFNFEQNINKKRDWKVNPAPIIFPEGKNWRKYVRDTRLEITCGEAPYLVSRYDTTTGDYINIENRIGLLDRKLRVINENVDDTGKWLKAAQIAYKNTYGFEWQGDSLLLAREAMLITFIENYKLKFGKEPLLKSIQYIAYIISWNVWQMDGLKCVVPNSCNTTVKTNENLFGEIERKVSFCDGCFNNNIKKHSGEYCLIKDWNKGKKIRFIDLIKL